MNRSSKLRIFRDLAESFLHRTEIQGVERTAWLEGYKHGITAALTIESDPGPDLSNIKTLDQFETLNNTGTIRKRRKHLFEFLQCEVKR